MARIPYRSGHCGAGNHQPPPGGSVSKRGNRTCTGVYDQTYCHYSCHGPRHPDQTYTVERWNSYPEGESPYDVRPWDRPGEDDDADADEPQRRREEPVADDS